MAKSLERFRDESREEFGEADIEAAFPVWLIDIEGKGRLSWTDRLGIAVLALLGIGGVVLAAVSNLVFGLASRLRGQSRKREPHERREIDRDVGLGRIVFRPNHIHVHEVREGNRAGGRVAELDAHTVVRMERDTSGLDRSVIEIDGVRWAVRSRHEDALRELLAARGVRIERPA